MQPSSDAGRVGRLDRFVGWNHVEREDQVARVVGAADPVVDVDVERARLGRGEVDDDVVERDPRLPPLQRVADGVRDLARGGRVGGREDEVVDGAAELRTHRPLAGRGGEDQPDALDDLAVAADQRDRAGRVGAQRERPAFADEVHRSQPPIMTVRQPRMIGAPQPARSPTRAAGMPPISTVVLPGGMIGARRMHGRRRERADVWCADDGRRHAADQYGRRRPGGPMTPGMSGRVADARRWWHRRSFRH